MATITADDIQKYLGNRKPSGAISEVQLRALKDFGNFLTPDEERYATMYGDGYERVASPYRNPEAWVSGEERKYGRYIAAGNTKANLKPGDPLLAVADQVEKKEQIKKMLQQYGSKDLVGKDLNTFINTILSGSATKQSAPKQGQYLDQPGAEGQVVKTNVKSPQKYALDQPGAAGQVIAPTASKNVSQDAFTTFKQQYDSGAQTVKIGNVTYDRNSPVVQRALQNPGSVSGLLTGFTPMAPIQTLAQKTGQATVQDQIANIDEEANRMMEEELNTIKNTTSKVDLSSSAALISKLTEALNAKANETPQTLQQTYADQRAALGVGELETSLASANADIEKLDASAQATFNREENRLVSMNVIRRRQSEEEIAYKEMRAEAVAKRDSIAQQLDMKYGVLNTMVQLAGQDINNAQQDYQMKFNQAIQMIDLVKGIENDQKSDQERLQDNARANIQIMANLITSGNLNYDSLDAATKLDLKKMELSAGLPVGFTEFLTQEIKDPVVSTLASYTDASGNRIQPIMTKNADGTFEIQNITLGQVEDKPNSTSGVGVGGSGSKGTPEQAITVPDGTKGGQCGKFVNSYSKLRLGDSYASKLAEMDPTIKKPEEGMVFVMPYKDTGHAGFIVSISKDGKKATVKDSNWSLDEKIQTHEIDVSKMTGFQRVWSNEEPATDTNPTNINNIPKSGIPFLDSFFGNISNNEQTATSSSSGSADW